MKLLRKAAAELLAELGSRGQLSDFIADVASLQIDRLTCEVRGAIETELVSLRHEDGRLQALCTCGLGACPHVSAVLQLLASDAFAQEPSMPVRRRAEHEHEREQGGQRASQLPQASAANTRLADALADTVTAVVRAGVCSEHVASVLESLSRVERALPPPLPLGLLRWLGRMREAIDTQDSALAAQALSAAVSISRDLRSYELQPGAAVRLCSWFGADSAARAQLSDQSLVEVAREWLHGNTRHQIERRYLLDLQSGECFREECARGDRSGSIGSCPRLIGVSLADVEPSCAPRRLRLLQYTTTPQLERTHWDSVAAFGKRDSDALRTGYRAAIAELGALAEPFALVSPRAYETDVRPSLLFERGAPLPLFADDEPGVVKQCQRLLRSSTVSWVAGRLLEHAGQVMLRPLAMGLHDAAGWRYERL